MDKIDIRNQMLKISFLETNPPINEIFKTKEEVTIIFQGHDNFYDFKKHLSSKIPIQLNPHKKKSLIMTLLKSNNIFATGLLTLRPGEQYVIFNYEEKKKVKTTKAVNINKLLDCIRIKILCEFDNNKDKDKDKENNNNLSNENKTNDTGNKYIPKVNLMKSNNNLKNKNSNLGKKMFDKKKKFLGNFYTNNSSKKANLINNSQDFCLGGDYSTYLTEEMNNNLKHNNNNIVNNINEIRKLNPYCSSKVNNNNNVTRKTEYEMSAKSKNQVNKAKSKNYFSTIKKQYKNFGNIKMNNSTLNLINQNNKLNFVENNENNNIINSASNTNRSIIKPTISFNKNNKRNININNKNHNFYNHNNLVTSLDNLISGQIVEHVDMSKKDNNKTNTDNNNNSEKKNIYNINKNLNNNAVTNTMTNKNNNNNNENKKKKFNNNNVTMNSISTAGTKKNELEFSINSIQDYDDKNLFKNSHLPFTNRINNERLQQKLSGGNNINNSNNSNNNVNNKHKFNKSLCQQSFTDKIFNGNDSNINLDTNEKGNNTNLCKSCDKLKNDNNNLNEIDLNNNDNQDNNGNDNKHECNEFQNVDVEEDYDDMDIDDNYSKIKEDFNLLYNDEYIKQINEDLLKLEVELFYEKMSELFSAYHLQMDEKILENQIIKRDYEKNIENYLLYIKLYNKLQLLKAQHEKKNLKEKGINLDSQNLQSLNININEFNIFKIIFPDEDNFKKLKKIVSIILKKQGNKELLDEKFKLFMK